MSKPFKHFGALRNGNGFGIAVDDLDTAEKQEIEMMLRNLKSQVRGVKFHPNYYPRGNKMLNAWVIPAHSEAVEPMLEIIDRFEFRRTDSANRLIEQIKELEAEQEAQRLANEDLSTAHDGPEIHIPHLVTPLRNYQKAAVDWVLRNRRVYIGDEMGTGKTVSSLAAVCAADAMPVVVLCPASIKLGWLRQIERHFPTLASSTFICNGRSVSKIPSGTKIVIINYDIVGHWITEIQRYGYGAIILDEAHFIKNSKAKRSRAATVLAQRAPIRIAMSGTPITSRPIDLVAQLNAINRLADFASGPRSARWAFIERYCRPVNTGYGWDLRGASNLLELNDRLRRYGILIRRRKEDVLLDLPPKERVSIPLGISNRKDYEQVRNDIAFWVEQQINGDEKFAEEIKGLSSEDKLRARERMISEKVSRANAAIAITRLNALRRVCMRGKIKAATEWIDDFLTSEEKLVVFCTHREAVETLSKHYGSQAVKIIGGMGAEAKQASIDAFIDNEDIRVVIANIDAAAEGIDGWQSVCSNVAFLELTWTPTKHHQAEDRCHRSGQSNPVTCYYLMATGTIDEYLANMIDRKGAVVAAAVDRMQIEDEDRILADLLRRIADKEF